METNNISKGGVPMVKIDGQKIRELRESQGLTQLYLATTVEVTTDTISRWENRRYPSVKKENALKLAEVLDVDLVEILDDGDFTADIGEVESPAVAVAMKPLRTKLKWCLMILLVAIMASVIWWKWGRHIGNELTAVRIMPEHSAPGQPFPVLLKIMNSSQRSLSFILREQIPEQAAVSETHSSAAVSVDLKTGGLKCLGKIKQAEKTLGYVLTSGPKAKQLVIEGFVTSRTRGGHHQKVLGDQKIIIAPFHWADTNMDNKIDDQEILAIYDDYSDVKGLHIDMDLIEDIWFGSGYRWDSKNRKFVIIP